MTHLEAQSYIMPFIEKKVPHDKQGDFVLHMKNCKKCHDELEIYYTLMVGMRQLDNNEAMSTDFSKDLERDLRSMSHGVRNRKGFKISAFSIFLTIAIFLGSAVYAGILARIYSFEQSTKASEQGNYYFHDSLGGTMYIEDIDNIQQSNKISVEKQISDYQRIDGYIRLEEDYQSIVNIGEEYLDEEAATD